MVDLLHRPQEPPGRARSLPGRPRLLLRPRPLTGLPTGHGVGVHAVPRRPRHRRHAHGLDLVPDDARAGHRSPRPDDRLVRRRRHAVPAAGRDARRRHLRRARRRTAAGLRHDQPRLVHTAAQAPAGHHPDPVHAQQPFAGDQLRQERGPRPRRHAVPAALRPGVRPRRRRHGQARLHRPHHPGAARRPPVPGRQPPVQRADPAAETPPGAGPAPGRAGQHVQPVPGRPLRTADGRLPDTQRRSGNREFAPDAGRDRRRGEP